MALANVNITDTFDVWRTRTNQIIVSLEQQGGSANAVIGAFEKANTANYFAYLVNANTVAAFDKANTGGSISYLAYDKANVANLVAYSAFVKANAANISAGAAFDKANAAYGAFDRAVEVGAAANSFMISTVDGANTIAIAAFEQANSGGGGGGGGSSITISNDVTSNATRYITFISGTTGLATVIHTSNTGLTFNPNTGTLSATIFNSLSDISLKENIAKIDNSLDVIEQLNGVKFNWKKNGLESYGVIAQDIEKVIPQLVNEFDGVKNVNYDGIIAFLIEAIKELNKKLENR